MDTTPHTPRRRLATRTRVSVAAGLIVLAGGAGRLAFAQQPTAPAPARASGPAARLLPAKPMPESDDRVVGRGAAPDYGSLVSAYPSAPQDPPPTGRGWLVGPGGSTSQSRTTTRPVSTTQPTVVAAESPSFIERTWSGMKEFVVGKPTAAAPVPSGTPMYTVRQPAARPAPVPVVSGARGTGVYAGPPAYRWYGWGTTTPGANPYAPTGQYPRGSANWYTQTGATPGAFPVPVVNPFRPEPGAEPPAYVRGATPSPSEPDYWPAPQVTAPEPRPVSAQPAPQPQFQYPGTVMTTVPVPPGPPPAEEHPREPAPIAQTPPPTPIFPAAAPAQAIPTVPVGQPVPAAAVVPSPTTAEPAPAPTNPLHWQRSGDAAEPIPFGTPGAPKPTVPVPPAPAARPKEPQTKEPPQAATIRAACRGLATVTEVRQTGPLTLVVKAQATTPADARAAFEAMSAMPQLEPYKIQFEAAFGQR